MVSRVDGSYAVSSTTTVPALTTTIGMAYGNSPTMTGAATTTLPANASANYAPAASTTAATTVPAGSLRASISLFLVLLMAVSLQ